VHCNTSPRVALAKLDERCEATLRDCFTACGVQPVPIAGDIVTRLRNEKFEGCVLPLSEGAEKTIETIRSSPLNRRIVLYGILAGERASHSLLKYGINVILRQPVTKSEAINRVRSTSMLLIHELRRYVRIPLAVRVTVQDGFAILPFVSREISGGGMSVESNGHELPRETVQLTFTLPGSSEVKIMAKRCWQAEGVVGFQFEDVEPGKESVNQWIDGWLGIG
jgi:PilZ domain